ncbi:MAG TPA: DNA topoisomerase IB [Puia sp.]|nr:DNA topoisomerase IB [Puia sp.]
MTGEVAELSKRKIKSIVDDVVKTAKAINLVYVSDRDPGIKRVRTGKTFKYLSGNSTLLNKEHLSRIKSLVIPPAWEDVWICLLANGHLQATGIDVKKRKQYRYHPDWNLLRNQTKFYHTYEFGKVLPALRLQIEKDLSLPGLPAEKVLATVVSLMERTNIRVGNSVYEKLYGSYGLTTLKDKHVTFNGNTIGFTFKGKKGIEHVINLKSKKLATIVKKCRDIPGKELFQYYNEKGERKSVDSGMVNDYIKNISGNNFSAKDFRTWSGTVHCVIAFKELGFFESQTEAKKKITEAYKMVSKLLGNTPNVCKKYYVHPAIINLYENKGLEKYIGQINHVELNDDKTGLTHEEKIVMKILESN